MILTVFLREQPCMYLVETTASRGESNEIAFSHDAVSPAVKGTIIQRKSYLRHIDMQLVNSLLQHQKEILTDWLAHMRPIETAKLSRKPLIRTQPPPYPTFVDYRSCSQHTSCASPMTIPCRINNELLSWKNMQWIWAVHGGDHFVSLLDEIVWEVNGTLSLAEQAHIHPNKNRPLSRSSIVFCWKNCWSMNPHH